MFLSLGLSPGVQDSVSRSVGRGRNGGLLVEGRGNVIVKGDVKRVFDQGNGRQLRCEMDGLIRTGCSSTIGDVQYRKRFSKVSAPVAAER